MHTRFRKALIITCCCLLTVIAFAQSGTDSLFTGVAHFRLGDPQSKFGDSLTLAMDSQYVSVTDPKYAPYPYSYKGAKPDLLNKEIVPFQSFVVWFDEKKILTQLYFTNLYGVEYGYPTVSIGVRHYKRLLDYFTDKTKQPAKKVVYPKSKGYVTEGYEWNVPHVQLILESQYDTVLKHLSISVYLKKK